MKSFIHRITLVLAIILVCPLFYIAEAVSSPTDCESINDSDARNYCKAMTTGRIAYCESIRNNDLRHQCRALVKK